MFSFNKYLTLTIIGAGLISGCEKERPPRTVSEMLESPILLEAAIVRCSEDRVATRYDAECVNARQAVKQIEAKEEAARRAEHEARSESKRQALRRTQEAAAQARRRAAEAETMRREAEYLAQFGVALSADGQTTADAADSGNLPMAVLPEGNEQEALQTGAGDVQPATDGGNAPVITALPDDDVPSSDLESIRDELQRRNDESND